MRREKGGDVMIKKRYLVVLSLAILSVLLGSLLYTTLGLAGKPEPQPSICKDSVRISLLSVGASGWESQGALIITGVHEFPFVFNPKEPFQNLTDLWFSFFYLTSRPTVTIDISLNNVYITSKSLLETTDPRPVSFQVTDTSLYYALTSGINVLTLTSMDAIYLQELTVFIEYEYQAR